MYSSQTSDDCHIIERLGRASVQQKYEYIGHAARLSDSSIHAVRTPPLPQRIGVVRVAEAVVVTFVRRFPPRTPQRG